MQSLKFKGTKNNDEKGNYDNLRSDKKDNQTLSTANNVTDGMVGIKTEISKQIEQEILEDLKNTKAVLPQLHANINIVKTEIDKVQKLSIESAQNFPIKLNFLAQFELLFENSIIKRHENHLFNQKIIEILITETISVFTQNLFWIILTRQFPQIQCDSQVKHIILSRINEAYLIVFYHVPKPKHDFIDYILFAIGYVINKLIFMNFSDNRDVIDHRFVANVYHLVLEIVNGVQNTDFYIQTMIDKIFTLRFLEYDQNKKTQRKAQMINQLMQPNAEDDEQSKLVIPGILIPEDYQFQLLDPAYSSSNKSPSSVEGFNFHTQISHIIRSQKHRGSQQNQYLILDQKQEEFDPNQSRRSQSRNSSSSHINSEQSLNISSRLISEGSSSSKVFLDRKKINKMRQARKIEVENELTYDRLGNVYQVISPVYAESAIKLKNQFNVRQVSPTLAGELFNGEINEILDIKKRFLYHPINRVIKRKNLQEFLNNIQRAKSLEQKSEKAFRRDSTRSKISVNNRGSLKKGRDSFFENSSLAEIKQDSINDIVESKTSNPRVDDQVIQVEGNKTQIGLNQTKSSDLARGSITKDNFKRNSNKQGEVRVIKLQREINKGSSPPKASQPTGLPNSLSPVSKRKFDQNEISQLTSQFLNRDRKQSTTQGYNYPLLQHYGLKDQVTIKDDFRFKDMLELKEILNHYPGKMTQLDSIKLLQQQIRKNQEFISQNIQNPPLNRANSAEEKSKQKEDAILSNQLLRLDSSSPNLTNYNSSQNQTGNIFKNDKITIQSTQDKMISPPAQSPVEKVKVIPTATATIQNNSFIRSAREREGTLFFLEKSIELVTQQQQEQEELEDNHKDEVKGQYKAIDFIVQEKGKYDMSELIQETQIIDDPFDQRYQIQEEKNKKFVYNSKMLQYREKYKYINKITVNTEEVDEQFEKSFRNTDKIIKRELQHILK